MLRHLIARWTDALGRRDRNRASRQDAFRRALRRELQIESLEVRNLLAVTPLGATSAEHAGSTLPVEADERLLVDRTADSGVVVFDAHLAAADFELRLEATGQVVQITQDGELMVERPLATLTQLTINGNSLDNTLTVDLTNGNPIPAGGLFYNGGDEATEVGDGIELVGGDAHRLSYTPTVGNDGIITLDPTGSPAGQSTQIYFTSLEPVSDNIPAPDLVVNGTFDGNAISYTNGPGAAGIFVGDTGLIAIDAFETYEFESKATLILNGQEGNDVITLNAPLQPTGLQSVMVDGGSDNDVVDLLSANVRNLTIDGNVGDNTTRIAGVIPGVFDSGNIAFQNTALEFELGGTMPGMGAGFHDQLNATGTVTIGNNVTLVANPFTDATGVNFMPAVGDEFVIIHNDGSDEVMGMFVGLPEGAQFVAPGTNRIFSISYRHQGNDVVLTFLGAIEVEIVPTATLDENGTAQDIQLSLSTPIPLPAQVDVRVSPVNISTNDNDYDAAAFPKIVSFTAGSTNGTTVIVQTTPTADNVVETDETLRLDLAIAAGPAAVGTNGSSTVTILNDDTTTLLINDVTLAEGNAPPGTTPLDFTVTLGNPVQGGLTLAHTTNDGTATLLDADYQDNDGTTLFTGTAGETQTIRVLVNHDLKVEADETFTVLLGALSNLGVGIDPTDIVVQNTGGDGLILNDDTTTLLINDVTLAEGNAPPGTTPLDFTVTLGNPVQGGLTLAHTTNDGTATLLDADYQDNDGTTLFTGTAGETQTIRVLVNHDLKVEADETFTVLLGALSNLGVGIDPTHIVVQNTGGDGLILNDDTTTLLINDVMLAEGNAPPGTTPLDFTVTLGNPVQGGLTLAHTTNDGTATLLDADYQDNDGTTLFTGTAGETQTIRVLVNHDLKVEADETFTVLLGALSNLGVGIDPTHIVVQNTGGDGLILNDDTTTLSIDDVMLAEGDSGMTNFVFTITSDRVASQDLTVVVNTADLLTGTDFTPLVNQTATIAAGNTSTTVTVIVTGETLVEIDETFNANLSDPKFNGATDATRVVIGDGSGLGTITDDDQLVVEFSQAMGMDAESTGGNLPQLLVTGQVQAGHTVTIDVAVIGTSTATGGGVDFNQPTTVTVAGGTYDATPFAIASLAVVDDGNLIGSDEPMDGDTPGGGQNPPGGGNPIDPGPPMDGDPGGSSNPPNNGNPADPGDPIDGDNGGSTQTQVGDALIEPDETIDLNTITGSQIRAGDADGDGTTQAATQFTIIDDDLLVVEFSQAVGTNAEPSGGNLPQLLATGRIQTGHSVAVDVAVIGTSTATGGGVDFDDPTTVTVVAGTYDATALAIADLFVVEDTLIEPDETIDLNTITGSQIEAGDADGDGNTQAATQFTITDNDLLQVEFSQAAGTDTEPSGGNLPQLLVTGQVQAGHSLAIDVAVIGTSTAIGGGVDFDDPTTVTVAAGTYAATALAIAGLSVADDTFIEPAETIDLNTITGSQVQAGDADNNAIVQAATQYTIQDDDLLNVRTTVGFPSPLSSILKISDVVAGGKDDQLQLSIVGDRLVITDLGNIIGDFTDDTTGNVVDVPLALISNVVVELLEGDDQLSIRIDNVPADFSITIKGGGGHDTLSFTGPTTLNSGDLIAADGVDEIFVNGPITTLGGTVTLNALQSLEVNADINAGAGVVHLRAGQDVFGNCAEIRGSHVTVEGITGIGGVRLTATSSATMTSAEGGIVGCDGQIVVTAPTATLDAKTGIGAALVGGGEVTASDPLRTMVGTLDAHAGGIGIFIVNQGGLQVQRAWASYQPAGTSGYPYGIIDITAMSPLTIVPGPDACDAGINVCGSTIFLTATSDLVEVRAHASVKAETSITISDSNGVVLIERAGVDGVDPKIDGPPETESNLPEGEAGRWHNAENPLDVDDDGNVSPLDVLKIVNHINAFGTHPLPEGESVAVDVRRYVDVNGDGFATPLDALHVINYLNLAAGGEGEGSQVEAFFQDVSQGDRRAVSTARISSVRTPDFADVASPIGRAAAMAARHVSLDTTFTATAERVKLPRDAGGSSSRWPSTRPNSASHMTPQPIDALHSELEILLGELAADVLRGRQPTDS